MKISIVVVDENESTIFGNEVLEVEGDDLLVGITINLKQDSPTSVILEYSVNDFFMTAEDFIDALLKSNKHGEINRINKEIVEKGRS